jgi:hypothetical protein
MEILRETTRGQDQWVGDSVLLVNHLIMAHSEGTKTWLQIRSQSRRWRLREHCPAVSRSWPADGKRSRGGNRPSPSLLRT